MQIKITEKRLVEIFFVINEFNREEILKHVQNVLEKNKAMTDTFILKLLVAFAKEISKNIGETQINLFLILLFSDLPIELHECRHLVENDTKYNETPLKKAIDMNKLLLSINTDLKNEGLANEISNKVNDFGEYKAIRGVLLYFLKKSSVDTENDIGKEILKVSLFMYLFIVKLIKA